MSDKKHQWFFKHKNGHHHHFSVKSEKGNGIELDFSNFWKASCFRHFALMLSTNTSSCALLKLTIGLWLINLELKLHCRPLEKLWCKLITNSYRQLGLRFDREALAINLLSIENDYEWENNWLDKKGLSHKHKNSKWFKLLWKLRGGWSKSWFFGREEFANWNTLDVKEYDVLATITVPHLDEQHIYDIKAMVTIEEFEVSYRFPYNYIKSKRLVSPSIKVIPQEGKPMPMANGKGENSWDQEDVGLTDISFMSKGMDEWLDPNEKSLVAKLDFTPGKPGTPKPTKRDEILASVALNAYVDYIRSQWKKYGKAKDSVPSEEQHRSSDNHIDPTIV